MQKHGRRNSNTTSRYDKDILDTLCKAIKSLERPLSSDLNLLVHIVESLRKNRNIPPKTVEKILALINELYDVVDKLEQKLRTAIDYVGLDGMFEKKLKNNEGLVLNISISEYEDNPSTVHVDMKFIPLQLVMLDRLQQIFNDDEIKMYIVKGKVLQCELDEYTNVPALGIDKLLRDVLYNVASLTALIKATGTDNYYGIIRVLEEALKEFKILLYITQYIIDCIDGKKPVFSKNVYREIVDLTTSPKPPLIMSLYNIDENLWYKYVESFIRRKENDVDGKIVLPFVPCIYRTSHGTYVAHMDIDLQYVVVIGLSHKKIVFIDIDRDEYIVFSEPSELSEDIISKRELMELLGKALETSLESTLLTPNERDEQWLTTWYAMVLMMT